MLTREQNEALTQAAPGTPMGELLRRYWQPVAVAEELPPGGAPVPVTVMHEELVLFRDETGRPGLLGLHCSHRAADLSYGRIEDGGLRCLYHGWFYDIHGNCLEQPGEPAGSGFHEKIRHPAYPCREAAGMIWAYLGPGEPPPLPGYEPLQLPAENCRVFKYYQECNYLQGVEGEIDPVHLSYLHRFFQDGASGKERTPANGNLPSNALYGRDIAPTIDSEETDFGVRIYSLREIGESQRYLRISNFVLPNTCAVPTVKHGYNMNWHVPIDDTHHWKYMLAFDRTGPIAREPYGPNSEQLTTPDYHLLRNQSNRFLQNREDMNAVSFSGLGRSFIVHDTFAAEGEGEILDRTAEHLGATDRAIIQARQMLLKAHRDVQEGHEPPHAARSPDANRLDQLVVRDEVIAASTDWKTYWQVRSQEAEMAVGGTDRTGLRVPVEPRQALDAPRGHW